jgi:hypothetical protein
MLLQRSVRLTHFVFGILALSGLTTLGTPSAEACQVPVFRYALERWSPDRYQVLVLSSGPLPQEMSQWLSPLRSGRGDQPAAVELQAVNVAESNDRLALELWKQYALPDSSPLLVARYPKRSGGIEQVAHVCPLTQENVLGLLNSPVRKELISRLTSGHAAVWVLIESGDKLKDAQALESLERQLALDSERLELPSAESMEVTESFLDELKIPLQLKFSVITVKRDDPKEKYLVDCLVNSESDLHEYEQEPLAFPVFGRGIVLYALVGNGISGEMVRAASKFIVGPCSCQVKEQNPGFDLLLDCDWDAEVGGSLISSPLPSAESTPRLLTIPPGRNNN